jgi:hypothetical protein
MSSLEVAFLLGVIVAVALGAGLWLFSTFLASKQEFSQVYPVSAYVDADGDFLLCVYNAGPHEFYGRWVLSVKSGRSVEVSLVALIITTGGGSSYTVYPIVVPDISSVSCG